MSYTCILVCLASGIHLLGERDGFREELPRWYIYDSRGDEDLPIRCDDNRS